MKKNPQLAALMERRTEILDSLEALADGARDRGHYLASEQRRRDDLLEQSKDLNRTLLNAESEEERRAADARAQVAAGQGNDDGFGRGADTIYARGSGQSYFRDLVAAAIPGRPEFYSANQRLQEHAQLIDRAAHDLPPEFRSSPERRGAGMEARTNPNRTDGQGGFFVPPLWLVSEYVSLLRAGRQAADRCNTIPLPSGTDSINLPKVATGAATGVQTADAGAVTSVDLTDTSVGSAVRTIAGQQDIALQLLEQSPIPFDEVVFKDLIADYNMQLDLQVLSGTNAAGQLPGILPMAGVNAVTYTDATPTLPELIVPMGQSLSKAASLGKVPPDTILMHPSLWYWMATQLDTTNRPLIDMGNGQNSIAVFNKDAVEGIAGSFSGTPIVVDLNVPTNLGGGTNETRIIAGAFKEAYLLEGALRTRVLVEPLSGTLQVRLQVYNYIAFIPNRRPAAFSIVSGTGLIAPAGF